jgi:hypothetical protein
MLLGSLDCPHGSSACRPHTLADAAEIAQHYQRCASGRGRLQMRVLGALTVANF